MQFPTKPYHYNSWDINWPLMKTTYCKNVYCIMMGFHVVNAFNDNVTTVEACI
jgi:hypothetical protein